MGNVYMEAEQIRYKSGDYNNVQTALEAAFSGSPEGLDERVTALETTVGDSSAGLVKDVDDLETTVGDSSAGLVKDVDDLETTVGDSSAGLVKTVTDQGTAIGTLQTTVGDNTAGLVKDVDDLQTTVGDNTGGLVKTVNDNSSYSATETAIGTFLGNTLYRKVYDFGALPNATSKTLDLGLSNVTIVRMYGVAASSQFVLPLPNIDSSNVSACVQMNINITTMKLTLATGADRSPYNGTVIVEYYKNPPTRDGDDEDVREIKEG